MVWLWQEIQYWFNSILCGETLCAAIGLETGPVVEKSKPVIVIMNPAATVVTALKKLRRLAVFSVLLLWFLLPIPAFSLIFKIDHCFYFANGSGLI
jgi:hypothetical protein